MSALAPTKFVLDNTMGAQLIGVLLAAGYIIVKFLRFRMHSSS
jgi:hypothetical protein